MRTLPLILTSALVALFAAGCGGDDEDNGSKPDGARGYAETAQAVEDVCTRAKAATDPLGEDVNGKAKHDAPLVEKLVATNAKYVEELKAIEPDPKLQAAFDDYVAAVDGTQAKAGAALDAAQSGDDKAYQAALEALSAEDTRTDSLARALGAAECAKD